MRIRRELAAPNSMRRCNGWMRSGQTFSSFGQSTVSIEMVESSTNRGTASNQAAVNSLPFAMTISIHQPLRDVSDFRLSHIERKLKASGERKEPHHGIEGICSMIRITVELVRRSAEVGCLSVTTDRSPMFW